MESEVVYPGGAATRQEFVEVFLRLVEEIIGPVCEVVGTLEFGRCGRPFWGMLVIDDLGLPWECYVRASDGRLWAHVVG